ncbi:MAG: 30S ribosomal protein S3 [Christensenellaceae bacterium]|jgi:small subunit ribosomal protein S3|nr:30S ribosomal protein S3 [Christensenellaceae bacterium]
MGQKVNPHGLRVGIIEPWSSKWYANKHMTSKYILEDYKIREYLKKNYYDAAISKINIERAANTINIDLFCGKPGVAIGKMAKNRRSDEEGKTEERNENTSKRPQRGIDVINTEIKKIIGKDKALNVNIKDIKNANLDSQLVAENIAQALERRTAFRRAMKQAIGSTMRAGAKGVKTMVSGRLDGAEIARSEHYHEGSIPLQTLRADIDYGFAEAKTTYGIIGVKVWIYKGEVFGKVKGGKD